MKTGPLSFNLSFFFNFFARNTCLLSLLRLSTLYLANRSLLAFSPLQPCKVKAARIIPNSSYYQYAGFHTNV